MILIESPDGKEQQIVSVTAGYPEWTVVASNVTIPEDDCEWDKKGKKWKSNEDHKKKRNNSSLKKVIADLAQRVEALENTLANQKK